MNDGKHHENGMCLHCGGAVDAQGLALGGEAEIDEPESASIPEELEDESPQMDERERLRAFGEALAGARR
jgi:hypothetical protein